MILLFLQPTRPTTAVQSAGLTKTAVPSTQQPDLSGVLSWGLKLTDVTQLFFVTGHGDLQPDFSSRFSGDPVAQTRHILEQVRDLLDEAGYSVHDIVRHDWTFTSNVTQVQFEEILGVWAEFLADVDPKPASGTLRYVDRLAAPDMMVEYEFLIAR